jgi:hypothetical protein
MKFRRIAGGLHRFQLNGKSVSVKTGGIIECNPEDLGRRINQYEKVSARDAAKTPLEAETQRVEFILRKKSIWLNDVRPDNTMIWIRPPTDLKGLEHCLWQKTREIDSENIPGELPIAKSDLRHLWHEWRYRCKQDPLGRLDPHQPMDKHLEQIAEKQASINIIEQEIEEIKRRILAAEVPIDAIKEDQIARLRFKGRTRCDKDYKMNWCDGRAVVQGEDDKPVFADDGKSVADYMDECKAHQQQAASKKAKRRRSAEKALIK